MATSVAVTAVTPDAYSLSEYTLEQFGGGTDVASNTTAWNAALAAISAAGGGILRIGAGDYNFTTAPNPIQSQCYVVGVGPGESRLIRNYSASSSSENFIAVLYSYGGLADLDIYAADGTSGGRGLSVISDDALSYYGNWNRFFNVRVHGGTGTWYNGMYLSGTNATSTVGLRDLYFGNCWVFNATNRAVYARVLKQFKWEGGGWLNGGGSNQTFDLDSDNADPVANPSQNVTLSPNVGGAVTFANTKNFTISGPFAAGGTVASSCTNGFVSVQDDTAWTVSDTASTLIRNGALEKLQGLTVSYGANDSGGSGLRAICVPNS